MHVRAQIAIVLNLDKCIGCHTCSVTCKNIWTNRKGLEYAWFNNVESKPGVGYPRGWEDQGRWRGGWARKNGSLELAAGGRASKLANLFANPDMPTVDDYAEPFTFDYAHLQAAPLSEAAPTARPRSLLDGTRMQKITWGPNWEDDLAGEFASRAQDPNFRDIEKEIYAEFENTFHMYLPRLCNHCLNPACVAACPSGSIYKREEDGIVLIDQDKCRGWRMCVSACPYKKIYYNWESGKSEKCLMCYPRIESGMPTACAESCVGRIRYLGVILYDADRIAAAANTAEAEDLYEAQLALFLNPNDPAVVAQARRDGVPQNWIEAASRSPVYKMAIEWRIAFPLHPEFRTLPMIWYVPPLSPVASRIDQGRLPTEPDGAIPRAETLRLPVKFLANLLAAGDEAPIRSALNRLLAMRSYQRTRHVEGRADPAVLHAVGLTEEQAQEMVRCLAIANYEDRFVIPTAQEELRNADIHAFQGDAGLGLGNTASPGVSQITFFPRRRNGSQPLGFLPPDRRELP
jgi:nitrate reductase beta subunit